MDAATLWYPRSGAVCPAVSRSFRSVTPLPKEVHSEDPREP